MPTPTPPTAAAASVPLIATPATGAAASVVPGVAAAPLAVSFSGFYGAVTEADDSDLALARTAGISDFDLGIGAATSAPGVQGNNHGGHGEHGGGQQNSNSGELGAAGSTAPGASTVPAGTVIAPPGGETAPGGAQETKEQRVERLKRELAEAEGGTMNGTQGSNGTDETVAVALPPVNGPLPGLPLAAVSGEQNFSFLADAARRVKSWAFQNRDGGEMPAEIASLLERSEALLTGRQAVEVKEPRYFDAGKTAQLFELSDSMLTEHLPARQQALAVESRFLGKVRTESPGMLDVKTEEGKMFYRVAAAYPALRQYPDWPLLVRHIARDYMAGSSSSGATASPGAVVAPNTLPAPSAIPAPGGTSPAGVIHGAPAGSTSQRPATEVAAPGGGGVVPLAPVGAMGGSSVGGVPISQTRINEAEARMSAGTASDEDWMVLSAAAV